MTMVSGLALPQWMRRTLLVTAALMHWGLHDGASNTAGRLRLLAGLPEGEHLYMWIVAAFVRISPPLYLAAGLAGVPTRCSLLSRRPALAFAGLLVVYWIAACCRGVRRCSAAATSRWVGSSACGCSADLPLG